MAAASASSISIIGRGSHAPAAPSPPRTPPACPPPAAMPESAADGGEVRMNKALLFVTGLALLAPSVSAQPAPPVAARKPHPVAGPGGVTRDDPYYWLRDDTRKNPEMLDYLKAENAFADAALKPLKPLQDKLYQEIVGRIKQDDTTVPYRYRGYYYYARFATGQDYAVIARRKGSMTAPEEVLLDEPEMARGAGYF